jgi:hypothetical protein
MKLFANRLLIVIGLISVALLFQITISSYLVFATERPDSNTNKTSYGFGLEPNVTNGSSPNQLTYRNSQHGISLLFPSNWTYSNSGLPEYTQIAAFYGPLQNLSDPIPPRLTITVMNYKQNVSLKDFTNMTLSSLNQTNQVKILNSDSTTLAGHPGYRVVFSTLPNIGNPVSFEIMHSWTSLGKKIYVLQYSAENSKFDTYLPTIKQILQSLEIESE